MTLTTQQLSEVRAQAGRKGGLSRSALKREKSRANMLKAQKFHVEQQRAARVAADGQAVPGPDGV